MTFGASSGHGLPFVAYLIVFVILHCSLHVHVGGKDAIAGVSSTRGGAVRAREPSAASKSDDQYIQLDELSKLAVDGALLAADLRQYVNIQQNRLDRLLRLADAMNRDSVSAVADPGNYLGNAVNSFRLARRLAINWRRTVNDDIRNDDREEFLKAIRRTSDRLPKPAQLSRLAKALFRLQDTYNLTSDSVARGELLPVQRRHHTANDATACDTSDAQHAVATAMTAEDSFELGRLAYMQSDYYHAVTWFEHARHLLNDETVATSASFNRTVMLDYLAFSLYQQGDVRGALKWTKALLKLDPGHSRALENKRLYSRMLDTMKIPKTEFVNERKLDEFRQTDDYHNYERLCRGEDTNTKQVQRTMANLSCRHVTNHPSLFLIPAREEQVLEDPPISIFHDVVTKVEAERLKELAQTKFTTSKVVPNGNVDSDKYDARSSKTAWLPDDEDEVVAGLSRKVSILSNLDKDTAEEFQVLSYGIGGHYVPHNDFLNPMDVRPNFGNRIATVLCYLSSVTAGGATVFPRLGVSVPPEEDSNLLPGLWILSWNVNGSCVFWYNLFTNGEGDIRSRHASCPVLVGFKWAFNKWFRERGQEFKRPCLSDDAFIDSSY